MKCKLSIQEKLKDLRIEKGLSDEDHYMKPLQTFCKDTRIFVNQLKEVVVARRKNNASPQDLSGIYS